MEAYKQTALCIAAVLALAFCVEAAVPLDKRGSCQDHVTGKRYGLGETWYTGPPRGCMSLTCDGPDTITGLTCAPFQVPSWCTVKPGNPNGVYPDCCPTPVCPELPEGPDAEENTIEGSSGPSSNVPKFSDSAYSDYFALKAGFPYPAAL